MVEQLILAAFAIVWLKCCVGFGVNLSCWGFSRFFLLILLNLHLFCDPRISVFEFVFNTLNFDFVVRACPCFGVQLCL